MTLARQRVWRIFWVTAAAHVLLIISMFFYSTVRNWLRRHSPDEEIVTFVSLHSPDPEPPAPEIEETPPEQPPAPEPPAPPPPEPETPPQPRVERSTQRVRRDPQQRPSPPEPTLTSEQIRQRLRESIPEEQRRPSSARPDEISRYHELLRETFYRAWSQPSSALPGRSVKARIRVRRDGTVIQRELVRRSGNSSFDNSVQRALDAVDRLSPLPSGLGGAHHDFTIEFELTGAGI